MFRDTAPVRAKILSVSGSPPDFLFPLNPAKITRKRAPQYADIPIAQGDGWGSAPPIQIEWLRNPPEDIQIEFLLAANGDEDVEADLLSLDAFLSRDARSGEPPDLVFSYGRNDRVRIFSKEVDEKIWHPRGSVQQATVRITFRTLRPRRGR